MSIHKKIDKMCCVAVLFGVLITVLFMNAEALGIQAANRIMGYESRLFDETVVHTIDIVIDDWDSFLSTCQSEEYSMCSVLIDGEAYTNVGIRGKGNTSLSTVSSMDSSRYSFKIEFDQYDSNKSYYGLDKLCLNNIIQDNTYMKDFLVYQMMEEFGVNAPLCSYVYITVNGEDWGLYLAVEGVEDSFLQRNYGSDYGELYKPDSMSFGGGRGNGKEFNMEDMDFSQFKAPDRENMPQGGEMPGKGGGFGMGSADAKLQYIDDDASSYSNIFNNAKTDISDADAARLIASLKALSTGESVESVVDIEEVLRYFVVHNFVVNGDSYTGSMIHNYYLYEEGGQLSMIPWDYNLAFGTFQSNDAEGAVNDPIDSPVSGDMEDRPMVNWIFESEEYTKAYHGYFAEFIEKFFTNGEFVELVDFTANLIAPYVEKDPTKFCTYEEFETGVATIREFCLLRANSVAGQLAGSIPSTSEGQSADGNSLVDASGITLSDMGTMNMGHDRGFRESFGDNRGERGSQWEGTEFSQMPENMPSAEDMEFLEDMEVPADMQFPGNMEPPTEGEFPQRQAGADNTAQIVLLVSSLVCLFAGLLVAWNYRR